MAARCFNCLPRLRDGRGRMTDRMTRRGVIAGSAACIPTFAYAQSARKPALGTPRSVISDPPREFGPRAAPSIAPDPDVLRLDPGFDGLLIGQEVIRRVSTGYHFTEGPAWNSEGQYAIFSDVKNDTHLSLHLGNRRGHRLPQALLQLQRQQLRLPGPPAHLPGFLPARDPVGDRRLDDGPCRQF